MFLGGNVHFRHEGEDFILESDPEVSRSYCRCLSHWFRVLMSEDKNEEKQFF